VTDDDQAVLERDIQARQRHCLAQPHAGDGEQAEQRGQGGCAQRRLQACSSVEDPLDLGG
jgi:hypothetical protein